ncbi:hypothetical protein [Gracilibacillus oryzae]|uniref:hypothetical protein n=1 Tax=Gracilibacillus oryzae TaxID=1672701 RepID=UPI001D193B31|nr:hypothetical protein [Gracilibacillus oryzae]
MDVRTDFDITDGDGTTGPWARDVKAGDSRKLTNGHNAGNKVRLHFSNDITTRVDTQAKGSWASN